MVPSVFRAVLRMWCCFYYVPSVFRAVFTDDLQVFAIPSGFRAVFPDRCEPRPGNKKAPQKCGAVKTQKHWYVGGHLSGVAYVNILAFFKVVASSQICPHFSFRAAKIHKKCYSQKYSLKNGQILLKIAPNAKNIHKKVLSSRDRIIFNKLNHYETNNYACIMPFGYNIVYGSFSFRAGYYIITRW